MVNILSEIKACNWKDSVPHITITYSLNLDNQNEQKSFLLNMAKEQRSETSV